MKKIIFSLLIFVSSMFADGTTVFAGFAMNGTQNFKSESPLGVFGIRYDTKYVSPFYRHISSIPQVNETQGINEFGLNLKLPYKFIEPYVGVVYTNDKLTSKYYTDQLENISYTFGITIKYKDKELYPEYRKNAKQDIFMFGFNLLFDSEGLSW